MIQLLTARLRLGRMACIHKAFTTAPPRGGALGRLWGRDSFWPQNGSWKNLVHLCQHLTAAARPRWASPLEYPLRSPLGLAQAPPAEGQTRISTPRLSRFGPPPARGAAR